MLEMFAKNLVLDVVEHPDPVQVLVVVSVEVFPVALVEEHLCVVFLILNPVCSIGNNSRSKSRIFSCLLSFPSSRNWSSQAGMIFSNLGSSKLSRGNQVPHESLDVFVSFLCVKAVQE